nr:MAG TPA: hypothetical protein [Caudoviricetes sp.]
MSTKTFRSRRAYNRKIGSIKISRSNFRPQNCGVK